MSANRPDRIDEITEWLEELDVAIERTANGAIATDDDGLCYAIADLGSWLQITQHLIPRSLMSSPEVHLAIADAAARVNSRPIGGCRLALDQRGLLLVYDLAPAAELETLAGALWMMASLGRNLLGLLHDLVGGVAIARDDAIDAALAFDQDIDDDEEPPLLN